MFNSELWQKPTAAGATGIYSYQIANSLRLNGTSQALERSFSSAASDDDKKALSFWIKRSGAGGTNSAFGSTTNTKLCSSSTGSGAVSDMLEINTNNPTGYSDQFHYYLASGGSNFLKAKWRDPSAWMHIVWIYNSDESTTTDRLKVYINGESNTINDSTYWDNDGNNGYPSSGADTSFGLNGNEMHIGRYVYDDAGWWGGQMADFIMIDGAASISDFGETHNGVWRPKNPSGLTFGNNGFWLKFTNASNPGEDFSGNDNDFTNIGSIPASATTLDSPTFNSGSNGGNFCTLNSIYPDITAARITNGNLAWGGSAGGGSVNEQGCMSTFAIPPSDTNIYYFEARMKTGYSGGIEQSVGVNIPTVDLTSDRGGRPTAWCITNTDYVRLYNGSNSYTQYDAAGSGSAGDILAVKIDRANTTITFYKNGTLVGSQTNLNTTTDLYPWVGTGGSTSDALGFDMNFGQNGTFNGLVTAQGETDITGYGNFYYDEAGSFKALCSGNLPLADAINPAETDDDYPQKLFSALAYSGGTTGHVTGFKPDLVWVKARSTSQSNGLWDSSRGTTKVLNSNGTGEEATSSGLTAFNTDGYDMGTYYNQGANTYASWSWRANGGTTSTDSNGSVSSTVQADPSGSFSMVKFVGGISGAGTETVGHGLNKAPSMIINFCYDDLDGGDGNRWVRSDELTNWNYVLKLNDTAAAVDKSGNGNMSAPTSTVFSINNTDILGAGSQKIISYCFANMEGYCKTGSYTGNASTDNAFVYTGFRPAFVLTKGVNSGDGWNIHDDATSPFNVADTVLQANTDSAELSNYNIDILSNGFKVRDADGDLGAARTYIYLAIAKNSFKYATAR